MKTANEDFEECKGQIGGLGLIIAGCEQVLRCYCPRHVSLTPHSLARIPEEGKRPDEKETGKGEREREGEGLRE